MKVSTTSFQDFCQKGWQTMHETQGLPSNNLEHTQTSTLAVHVVDTPWGQHTRCIQHHLDLGLLLDVTSRNKDI